MEKKYIIDKLEEIRSAIIEKGDAKMQVLAHDDRLTMFDKQDIVYDKTDDMIMMITMDIENYITT